MARYHPEDHNSARGAFTRDRARIVHSSAFRRLAQKTQVLSPILELEFTRNRLTHSLEVAQIGRELAQSLGVDPDIVDAACLAHDIGHPPFGHNGETALDEWAAEIGGFEGNAQTFRVLVQLEPKRFDEAGKPHGLNLSRATLDAVVKYPWSQATAKEKGTPKFGYYEDDLAVYSWTRAENTGTARAIEAEIMDLSDDIGYSVHDFEDAIFNGFIDPQILNAAKGTDAVIAGAAQWSSKPELADEYQAAFDRLIQLPEWPISFDGSYYDQANLKNLTSNLIGRFARATIAATNDAAQPVLGRHQGKLIRPRESEFEIELLKGIVGTFVMKDNNRQPMYLQQRSLLKELADRLFDTKATHLDALYSAKFLAATSEAEQRRIIVDQIASLTDRGAMSLHAELQQ